MIIFGNMIYGVVNKIVKFAVMRESGNERKGETYRSHIGALSLKSIDYIIVNVNAG
jgi:hypothetical protein